MQSYPITHRNIEILGSNLSFLKEMRDMEEYLECLQAEKPPVENIVTESWLTDADKFPDTSDAAILKELMSSKDFQQSNAAHDRVKEQLQKFNELYESSKRALTTASKSTPKS
jgi:hypothetical protein